MAKWLLLGYYQGFAHGMSEIFFVERRALLSISDIPPSSIRLSIDSNDQQQNLTEPSLYDSSVLFVLTHSGQCCRLFNEPRCKTSGGNRISFDWLVSYKLLHVASLDNASRAELASLRCSLNWHFNYITSMHSFGSWCSTNFLPVFHPCSHQFCSICVCGETEAVGEALPNVANSLALPWRFRIEYWH